MCKIASKHNAYERCGRHLRYQADPHFLVEHLQHLFARTALEQLAVHLKAFDRFRAAFCRTKIEGGTFRGVVFAGLCQSQYDMLDLTESAPVNDGTSMTVEQESQTHT